MVPGTLRDSLFILGAIHNLDGGPRPETIITDTASYSGLVFGLFAICGYQFSPRIADLADMRLWGTNTRATYGPLEHSPATPSGWTGSELIGATCCGWPAR